MSGTSQDTDAPALVAEDRNVPISITPTDTGSTVNIERTVQAVVGAHAKEYTNKFLVYLLLVVSGVVVGAIAASMWSLNSAIYQAVGATSVSTKSLELEISRLRDDVKKQQQQLTVRDCLENKKVTDKGGCYRGS